MRILLIDPPFKRLTGLVNNYFPIRPGYLAAVARNMGHDVSIYEVDAASKATSLDFGGEYKRYDDYLSIVNDRKYSIWQEIKDQIKNFHPDLVGISSITPKIPSALVVTDVSNFIKNGEIGFVVPIKDSATLAEKVSFLIEDEELRKSFGQKARNAAVRYLDVNICTRNHAEFYMKIMNNE